MVFSVGLQIVYLGRGLAAAPVPTPARERLSAAVLRIVDDAYADAREAGGEHLVSIVVHDDGAVSVARAPVASRRFVKRPSARAPSATAASGT